MKKLLLLCSLFSIISSQFLTAQSETAVQDTSRQSLLWKVTGNGLEMPSYVFGTIHMIGKDDYFFTDEMQKALEESEEVVFEIKMDDMMNLGSQMSMMGKIFMKDGTTLKDLLEEEEYDLVQSHFKEMGLPLMFLERMKPMFLSVFASGDMSPTSMQSGKIVSYEMEIMKQAENAKKPMAGLETVDFQMGLFDSIPYDAQAKMLLESIKMEDEGNDQFEEMVKLYKSQNIEAMQSITTEEEGGLGDYENLLLTQRNENWIPKMQEMMSSKKVFFAVGAGHLGGEKGVIRLLEEAGYTVEPIR